MDNLAVVVFGSVGLKRGRIKNSQAALTKLMKEFNPPLIEYKFLENAPFDFINGIVRWGDYFSDEVEIKRIDRKHKELQIAFEVPLDELRMESVEVLEKIYGRYIIKALRQIAGIYNLKVFVVDQLEASLGLCNVS